MNYSKIMYKSCVMLKDGHRIEGYINYYTKKRISSLFNKWLNKFIEFDIYKKASQKTDSNTGWDHKCYLHVRSKEVIAITYEHIKFEWWKDDV